MTELNNDSVPGADFKESKQISISLPHSIYEILQKQSIREGCSLSSLAAEALEQFLNEIND